MHFLYYIYYKVRNYWYPNPPRPCTLISGHLKHRTIELLVNCQWHATGQSFPFLLETSSNKGASEVFLSLSEYIHLPPSPLFAFVNQNLDKKDLPPVCSFSRSYCSICVRGHVKWSLVKLTAGVFWLWTIGHVLSGQTTNIELSVQTFTPLTGQEARPGVTKSHYLAKVSKYRKKVLCEKTENLRSLLVARKTFAHL